MNRYNHAQKFEHAFLFLRKLNFNVTSPKICIFVLKNKSTRNPEANKTLVTLAQRLVPGRAGPPVISFESLSSVPQVICCQSTKISVANRNQVS